jgi:hypothetical protein
MSVIQYRAYHVGEDDRYKAGFNLNCADDQEAIAVVKRLADRNDVELWQGGRKVARLQDRMMGFRAPPQLRTSIQAWAAARGLTLSEATRRLVEMGLERQSKLVGKRSAKSAERAKQLAAKAIEDLVDPAAPAEEAANRKRRLLKGPEEFREQRRDQLKGR